MDHELTIGQAREIARLRWRHPGADLLVHHRAWGLIVEVRDDRRTVELVRLDWAGGTAGDAPLTLAA